METSFSHQMRGLTVFVICILALLGAWYFWVHFQQSTSSGMQSQDVRNLETVKSITSYANAGDYNSALQAYEKVVNSATTTPDVRAQAAINGSHLAYLTTGDISYLIGSIQELKRSVAQPSLGAYIQAKSIMHIAQWYAMSGYNDAIYTEIFKDDPYRQYIITPDTPSNRRASIRKLLLWSYDIMPLYRTGAAISKSYTADALLATDATSKNKNVENAELYLARANDAVAKEGSTVTSDNVNERGFYLYDRAFVVGTLASLGASPYKEQYRQAYTDVFDFFRDNSAIIDTTDLPITHWRFAEYLLQIDNDVDDARIQLKEAVTLAEADPFKAKNSLVTTIKSIKTGTNATSKASLNKLMSISPEFKAFVAGL